MKLVFASSPQYVLALITVFGFTGVIVNVNTMIILRAQLFEMVLQVRHGFEPNRDTVIVPP